MPMGYGQETYINVLLLETTGKGKTGLGSVLSGFCCVLRFIRVRGQTWVYKGSLD